MLARNTENKVIGWTVEAGVNHNQSITGADCEPLVQEIEPIDSSVGDTAQQRMGDRIKPKSLKIKGIVTCNQTFPTASSQPLYVRVIIASQKDIKVGSAVLGGSVDTNRLLHPALAGAGNDQVPFNGNTQELQYPVNRNKFKVYMDKIIRLAPVVSATAVEQHPLYTGTYSYTFKSLPSNLTYDEGNANWANNFAPFVTLGYAYTDGSGPELSTVTRIKHFCYSRFEFEDA